MSVVKVLFEICEENCTSFIFDETTGLFNSTTNPTGWNGSNPNIALTTAATLDIYYPGDLTTIGLTIDLFATTDFPSTTSTPTYTITNTALGLSGRLTDGLWKFVYTVVVDGQTFQQSIEKITYCNAKCCVDGLFGAIDDLDCRDCQKIAEDKALTAFTLYRGMISAATCGKINKFTRLQTMLTRLCNNTNCCN